MPDDVALRCIFVTLARPRNLGAAAQVIQNAKLGQIGLNAADRALLTARLFELYDRFSSIKNAASTDARNSLSNRASYDSIGAAITDMWTALQTELSPDGLDKFQKHILHVKTCIKIYPAVPVASH